MGGGGLWEGEDCWLECVNICDWMNCMGFYGLRKGCNVFCRYCWLWWVGVGLV